MRKKSVKNVFGENRGHPDPTVEIDIFKILEKQLLNFTTGGNRPRKKLSRKN